MLTHHDDSISTVLVVEDEPAVSALVRLLRKQPQYQVDVDSAADLRKKLAQFGQTWNDAELVDEFEIELFDPPYVRVINKATTARGTVMYTENPRVYFYFCPLPETVSHG